MKQFLKVMSIVGVLFVGSGYVQADKEGPCVMNSSFLCIENKLPYQARVEFTFSSSRWKNTVWDIGFGRHDYWSNEGNPFNPKIKAITATYRDGNNQEKKIEFDLTKADPNKNAGRAAKWRITEAGAEVIK